MKNAVKVGSADSKVVSQETSVTVKEVNGKNQPEDYPRHGIIMQGAGLDKVCPYKPGMKMDMSKCPHIFESPELRKAMHAKKIKDNITDCFGNTPLVRINTITKEEGIECELLAKCEFLNPGGSVKDRIGRRMIADAAKQGRIQPGGVFVEPTSGNTGIGLAVAACAMGYKMIITLPERMSQEKEDVLRALGAEVVRTPNECGTYHAGSHYGVAERLSKELGGCLLNQYANASNPITHYEETAEELWEQCDGKIDYVFIGSGTGGTLTGISRKLKEKDPNIKFIGVDPPGSVYATDPKLNEQKPKNGIKIEGIGHDYLPRALDRSLVDDWIKVSDEDSFKTATRMIRSEGFLCGGSSGTALAGAIRYIK